MKKIIPSILLAGLIASGLGLSAQVNNSSTSNAIPGTEVVKEGKFSEVPDFVRFKVAQAVTYKDLDSWMKQHYHLQTGFGFKLLSKQDDQLGFTHYHLQQTIHNIPVEGAAYKVHTKTGTVESMNGQLLTNSTFPSPHPKLKEKEALKEALQYTDATAYKWQSPEAEKMLKETTKNPNATFYPKGELVYLPENGKLESKQIHLAYKFDVYAVKPLSRKYVFVDAITGKVIYTINRIENTDVTASATTQYSGVRTITTSGAGGAYILEESGRGNGIQTLNLETSTNYNTAVDFSNATTSWNDVDAQLDQYATDAHLAAEATYDFYKTKFGRNSIDGQGLTLVSYVHYDQQYDNAFWDGTEMNYGDGSAATGTNPLTSLEIGGHEITHGLTQYTANLVYLDESGGLDESFSDCMGVTIRQSIKQSATVDYLIGDELGINTTFRSMANPKLYQQPSTYLGEYWYIGPQDDGGVHTNSGVQNYWYYLVGQGGSGTNDNGVSYNITGIGLDKAAAITFRNLTVYLTSNAQYADARTYSIQAATDLYGACSPEVETVANAWYAVGVGDAYSAVVSANFNANTTAVCSTPANIYFTSTSANATNYQWDFGDGSTSGTANPTHVYNSYGNFTVKLVVSSTCGTDSTTKYQFIHINNNAPVSAGLNICPGNNATLQASAQAGNIEWYSAASGGTLLDTGSQYVTPVLNSSATYYAETDIPAPVTSCGPATDNFSSGSYYTGSTSHAVIFNCVIPQTLVSVDVYGGAAGERTISLLDSAGDVILTSTVNVAAGLNTVMLNFALPVANNLYLSCSGNINLYRNRSGANYPYYSTDSSVVLTNSDAGVNGYYYFFYNWKLQGAPCTSARVPVLVSVIGSSTAFSYTNDSTTASFTPQAAGLSSYEWIFGDGSTSAAQNPSHTYAALGTYTVTLIESNGTCTDTVNRTIQITLTDIEGAQAITALHLFPNPTNNLLHVEVSTGATYDCQLVLNNVIGETLLSRPVHLTSGTNAIDLDVSSYTNGIYLLSLKNNNGTKEVRRFVKAG